MAVALKVNGVACRDLEKRNGVAKLSAANYNGAANISPAPVLYFTYEDHDTTVEDYSESGTDHDGAGTSTERDDSTAKRGTYSLDIDAGDVLDVAHHADLDFDYDDPWTVSAWVKYASGGSSAYRAIYTKRVGGGHDKAYKGVGIFLTSGRVECYIIADWDVADQRIHKKSPAQGGAEYQDDAWHHYVVTYDGSGDDTGVLLYVDGASVTFTTQGGKDTVGTAATTNTEDARIGGASDNTSQGIVGLIDETAVWNVALTANQASVLYNSGSPADTSRGL